MSALKTEKYFLIKLEFKKKSDASTKTVWVGEKSIAADYLYSGSPEVLGILISIDGFAEEMGEVLSKNSGGSISLKATRGTVAFHKRIYDLLDEYVFINQQINCYSFQKKRGQEGSSGDLVVEAVGKVANYSLDIAGQTFNIEVNSNDISTNIINSRYNLESSDFPDGEFLNSGQNVYAPIVFGEEVEIVPVPLVQDFESNDEARLTARDAIYGLCSVLGVFDVLESSVEYIQEGKFIDENGAVKTAFLSNDNNELGAGTGTEHNIDPYNAAGNRIYYVPLQSPVIDTGNRAEFVSSMLFWAYCTASRTEAEILAAKGEIEIELGKITQTENGTISFFPIRNAKAKVEKVNYSYYGGTTIAFYMIFRFERIPNVNFQKDNIYGKIVSTGLESETDFYFKGKEGTGEKPVYYQDDSSNNNAILEAGFSIVSPSSGTTGILYQAQEAKVQNSAGDFTQLNLNFDVYASGSAINKYNIERESTFVRDLVVTFNGIRDAGDGRISGTNHKILTSSFEITKLIYYLQNGNSLTGFDTTRFSDAESKAVDLRGVEYSPVTYRELLTEILEAGSSAFIKNRDGSFSFWTYTCTQTSAGIISEEDCKFLSMDSLGVENIINKLTLAYDKKETPLSTSSVNNKYYSKLATLEDAESQSVYGELEPLSLFTENKWISDDATKTRYLNYKIQQRAFERFELKILVPYWKNNYRDFELWDIIDLNHIDNPSKSGSLPPNQTKALFDSDSDGDWALGEILRHAKNLTCRIIGRRPLFNVGEEAQIEFTLRTLGKNETI